MDFFTKVNSIRDNILNQPEYKIPIQSVIKRADEYVSKKNLEEKENLKNETEITL